MAACLSNNSGSTAALLPLIQGPLLVSERSSERSDDFGASEASDHTAQNLRQYSAPGRFFPVRFSLVIPTYNERDHLPRLLAQISSDLDACLPQDYEIIVVDDDSRDRTWALALALTHTYPALRVVRRRGEQGLATAVVRGWQVARGEILGVIDADGQHPTDVIGPLLQCLESKPAGVEVDLAIASRYGLGGRIQGWSRCRWLLSRGAQGLSWLLLPSVVSRVSDPMSGFFVVRRRAIAGRLLCPRSYKLLLEILVRGQIGQIAEVGYTFRSRQAGLSKVSWRQYRDYLLHLGQLRWVLFWKELKRLWKGLRYRIKHKN